MFICPKCRTSYTSSLAGSCFRDGEKLVDYDTYLALERDPMRGRTIGGKYTLVERIGVGGMGNVYKASQAGLRRNVAVKILKPELTRDADTIARFSREATAMSLLTHANTTRVYDFGQTDDGQLYLVMEYLEGQLVTQRVAEHGPLPVIETLRIGQQILRSLAEAHTKGIVHRDLKPDNIFIAKSEGHHAPIVKVLDFGIAKVVAPDRRVDQFETQAGTVFGTPRYMSPEQAQGAPLDQRSDLYSVGALLYQMLTGRAPFTDDDAVVVMAKHIRETPELPTRVVPNRPIPKSLEAVVMRALAKTPEERFQTAGEFEAALEECVTDVLAAEAASVGPPPPRPRRTMAWTLVVCTLAAASYAGFRALAKVNELPLRGGVLRDASVALGAVEDLPEAGSAPLAQPVERPAEEDLEDQEAPLPEGPGPAVVAIRSEPNGATVYRDGARLGQTPISLLVKPDEPFVRVELRLEGYLPLEAELTAKDGERLLQLNRVPVVAKKPAVKKPVHPARKERPAAAHAAPAQAAPKAPDTKPEPTREPAPPPARKDDSPYERFE